MTPLTEKEQLSPPTRKKRWWPFVVALCAVLIVVVIVLIIALSPDDSQGDGATTTAITTTADSTTTTTLAPTTEPATSADEGVITQSVGGVTYTLRPTTSDEHPTAISLENYYTLIRVEGTPDDQIYRVPSFVGDDMSRLVTVVAGGAFDGTGAQAIDLGYNVRYVWGDALGADTLTDLYLHSDVFIDSAALDNCTDSLTIHCPSYIENTQGELWSQLAADYGFVWKDELV